MAIQLNDAQLKAVYALEPKVVVMAPPGAGKTATMCAAIQEYACLHPGHAITAITYTKKAATELAERIHNPKVKTGTIHSWALQQLYYFGAKYGFAIELLEEEEMRRIMQKIAYHKKLRFVNIYQLYNYIVGNIRTLDIDDSLVQKYEKIKANYIQYKHDNHLYDFTDLPQYLLDVLEEYEEEIYSIDGFFVDEFQDIDAIQYSIFQKVNASKKFFIGDFRQAIYSFNGSLEDVFERLTADDFVTYHLDTNYRSKQTIMDAADSFRDDYNQEKMFITQMTRLHHSPVVCSRGEGGELFLVRENGTWNSINEEENFSRARQIVEYFFRLPGTMVLCRTNKQVRKLQALGVENCSTVHQAKGLEYDNVILCDMLVDNQEELNVAYVGMTRAKNALCVINFDCFIGCIDGMNFNVVKPVPQNILF